MIVNSIRHQTSSGYVGRIIYSLSSVPSEPQNPDIQSIAGSPTELLVMWDPPAEPNGVILTYTVYCYVLANDSLASESFLLPLDSIVTMMPSFTQVPGNQTEVVVVDLVPYTDYFCFITANTSIGESNSSNIVFNRTDESGKKPHK